MLGHLPESPLFIGIKTWIIWFIFSDENSQRKVYILQQMLISQLCFSKVDKTILSK